MGKLNNSYPKCKIFIKSIFYSQLLIILVIFISYFITKEYDNPIENISGVIDKVFFISTIPMLFSMLWIVLKEYTQKDKSKVFAIIIIIFLINVGILSNFNIPLYNNTVKFSGGSFTLIIPLLIVSKLLPKH